MAQVAGTHSSYDAIGNREDLSDVMYLLYTDETPALSKMPRGKAEATYHE